MQRVYAAMEPGPRSRRCILLCIPLPARCSLEGRLLCRTRGSGEASGFANPAALACSCRTAHGCARILERAG